MKLIPWYYKVGAALVLCAALYAIEAYRLSAAVKRGDHTGYQRAVSEQTAAAAKKAIENAQKERDDAKRITDAMRTLQDAQAQLAVLRARPQPHLVCSRAPSRPDRVSESAGLSADHAPQGGLLPEANAGDSGTFDPGPDLDSLALEMAADVARCRMFVQQVLGHVPTR